MATMYLQKNNSSLSDELPGLAGDALVLLKKLIATPSFCGGEGETAEIIEANLRKQHIKTYRMYNHVWAYNKYYDKAKPTILLNSRHDTAKPGRGYSRNPYFPQIEDNKLYGLGSNNAGGSLVSLLALFKYFYSRPDLPYNLCFAATVDEEKRGADTMKMLLAKIGKIDFAITGAPTQMQMATMQMGRMLLDCISLSTGGYAGSSEANNALYQAMPDIQWFSTFRFPKESAFMGPVKMTLTGIRAGSQYDVVPQECHFTVDIRLSDCYSAEEVFDIIKRHTKCIVQPRPGIVKPYRMDNFHPIVRAGVAIGLKNRFAPVNSVGRWHAPFLTLGPGDPARSFIPNEYIFVDEISDAISTYIQLLNSLLFCLVHNPEHNFDVY